jgi:hypothetical protein
MGKPGKAVFHSSLNARRPVAGRGAWQGAMSSRPKTSFPFRFWSLVRHGVFSKSADIPCYLKHRAVYRKSGARPAELPDDRTCGLHGVGSGIGGRHGEEFFFEVLVVPFV